MISFNQAIHLKDSVIIIGSLAYKEDMYQQLIKSGYPLDRVCQILIAFTGDEYFGQFKANDSEVFVDAGSLNGNTALKFTQWATKGYDYIYSFEPNPYAIDACRKLFEEYNLKGEVISKGLWDKSDKLYFQSNGRASAGARITKVVDNNDTIETIALDEVLNGNRVTFIKMDIEGSEYKALLGSEKTIKKWKPRMAICVYHKPEDILEIPTLLLKFNPDYKFALRHYRSYEYDTVLYAY